MANHQQFNASTGGNIDGFLETRPLIKVPTSALVGGLIKPTALPAALLRLGGGGGCGVTVECFACKGTVRQDDAPKKLAPDASSTATAASMDPQITEYTKMVLFVVNDSALDRSKKIRMIMGMQGCDQKLKQQAMQAIMSGKPFEVPSSGTAQATVGANLNGAAPAPAPAVGGAVKGEVPRKAAVLDDDEQETQMDELFSHEERLCWQVCLDGIWTEMDGATNALLEEAQKSG